MFLYFFVFSLLSSHHDLWSSFHNLFKMLHFLIEINLKIMFFNRDMYKIYFTNSLIRELIEKQIMIWTKYSILSIFLQGNSSRKKKNTWIPNLIFNMDVIFGIMSPILFEISLHGHLIIIIFMITSY